SKSDKSDLVTYTAVKSGSDWTAPFDIAKHKYNTGTYSIEAAAEANNGISMTVKTGSMEFDASAITCDISAAVETGQVRLGMSRVRVPDIEAAYFAVWSKVNDQDDLVWHEVTLENGAGEKLLPLSECKDIGDYNVHAYVRQTDGTMVFLGKTIFNLRKFGANSVRCTPNNNEGTFQVLIKGVKPVENVKSVVVEVWSDQDGKDDVRSYTAKKQENGDYLVTSGIDKHKYNEGL
ncbi:MAG: GBS Bsp-like repeat-containing protein, partial [Lachnospiraceae bacterium]|nr:GBS Bsp-like repeat-containing protein [Lachnospiraceae bacterium]